MTCPSIFALAVAMATEREQVERKPATSAPVVGASAKKISAGCEPGHVQSQKRGIWLWATLAAACIVLSAGGHALAVWIETALGLKTPNFLASIDGWVLVALLLLYIVLLALPFIPGAEIGIILLMVLGAKAALPVYCATVFALVVSFLVGHLIPLPRLVDGLKRVGMLGAADFVQAGSLAVLQPSAFLTRRAWAKAGLGRLLRHRCVALGVLLNTPGNSLLGGGGGIALAAGASRLLTFPQFLATVAIAVAPVPAAILIASTFTRN